MSSAELKVEIFRKIDRLDEQYLNQIYEYIDQLLDKNVVSEEWDRLSDSQKRGIIDAINSTSQGKTIPHNQVISKYKRRYGKAL